MSRIQRCLVVCAASAALLLGAAQGQTPVKPTTLKAEIDPDPMVKQLAPPDSDAIMYQLQNPNA